MLAARECFVDKHVIGEYSPERTSHTYIQIIKSFNAYRVCMNTVK